MPISLRLERSRAAAAAGPSCRSPEHTPQRYPHSAIATVVSRHQPGCAVPAAVSTEAFTWTFAVITVGMAAGGAVGGTIIQAASPQVAFLAAGSLSLVAAALGTLMWSAAERPG
jgi:predicted MFS family arabinose efflux permease